MSDYVDMSDYLTAVHHRRVNLVIAMLSTCAAVLFGALSVAGLLEIRDSRNTIESLQNKINNHVMKFGDGTITCDFGMSKNITIAYDKDAVRRNVYTTVFYNPKKLDEPLRNMMTEGLSNGDCVAKLG